MSRNDKMIFKKFARLYKTQEKFTDAMMTHPDINMMQRKNPKMARLTLEAYWKYYRDLSSVERGSRKVKDFVHGYVSKNIYENLT